MGASADLRYERLCARLFVQNTFAIKLGLERMQSALARLDHPDRAFEVVVVAGTNGKGTTGALLSTLLRARGHRVGFYTSPHLCDLRERFRVDGTPLPRAEVLDLAAATIAVFGGFGTLDVDDAALGREVAARWGWPRPEDIAAEERLTFFELTTIMALEGFRRRGVDIAVLEVGLGGRLDAVNAVEPALTVITSIGLDHQEYLGESLGEIAAEKAGTMRAGRPTVVAPQAAEAMASLEAVAASLGATLHHAATTLPVALPDWLQHGFEPNVATAWTALQLLHPEASPDTLAAVLSTFRWPGRRDLVTLGTGELAGLWLLDAAHNPHGAETLARWLQASPQWAPAAGVFGAMRDKDIAGVAAHLVARVPRWWTTAPNTPRAATPEALAEIVEAAGGIVTPADSVRAALVEARCFAGDAPVLVCGSIYLLGEVLTTLEAGDGFFALVVRDLSEP